ncbi:hypothetical protein IT575_07530 [bacterium]|nr:hypothetical protein [bacterium]
MDVGAVLDMAGALKSQQIAQQYQSMVLLKMKDQQKIELSLAAKLLASVPSAQPEGVGGRIDLSA